MELFDYADARVGTTVSCTSPSTTGYEADNLLRKHHGTPGTGCEASLPLLPPSSSTTGGSGFMAESFVRPPVDVDFALPHMTSVAAIVVDPRIRRGRIVRQATVFAMGVNRTRWERVGSLEVAEDHAHCCVALHNADVAPAMLRAARIHGSNPGSLAPPTAAAAAAATAGSFRPVRWSPLRPPTPGALHHVGRIRLTIVAMHDHPHVPPGLGGIAILGQPSQRLPREQRIPLWTALCRGAVGAPGATDAGAGAAGPDGHSSGVPLDCPPEFVDPITHDVMPDPVVLPSAVRCDRSTIARHLGGGRRTDPFTGLPLDPGQIHPDLALRLRIQAWLEKTKNNANKHNTNHQC
ncbi:Ubiquitin conjugation factor E4 A [Coemansia sp. RSA 2049]|nr:Ubiquitin conjugation factor E4 A [Coemansia sp. RSA 2049]KAJ2513109.1 Ubiquitin conjugation factor E4 A [Coemansia sp. RSA 1939]KAJ2598709.1 Ubiquitin conjugation factor E4 A [Coemansia sp. RSA 1804]KAJ2684026.1 Ubiquitin conjugation factor E4 A [Coemansia sp. RSA 1285]